jgi:hypothetical protein
MADMYNDQRQKIGTKTVQQGAGLKRQDGSYGNGITMNFAPPPTMAQPQQAQVNQGANFNNSYGGMAGGVTAPKVQYETPTEGMSSNDNFSRIIRNLAMRKNADMQFNYDKTNSELYRSNQDRLQKESIFNRTMDNSNQQFDRNFDYRAMQDQREQAVKNIMTPYQQAEQKRKDSEMRLKNFDDNDFRSMMPEDVADEINDRNYAIAKRQFIETGQMPQFNKSGSWYDDDYSVAQAPVSQEQQQNTQSVQRQAQIQKLGFDPNSNTEEARAYRRYIEAKNR